MDSQDQHTAKCRRCGSHLRSAASITRGYSARCWKLARREAVEAAIADFSPAQQDKAMELIADGGLVPTARPGMYRAVSSDGTAVYLAGADICSCLASQNDRRCYHQASARIADIALTFAA